MQDGRRKRSRYPSVTEVLAPWTDFSRVPGHILEHAARRGTKVHNACAAYARGLFPVLDSETKGYFKSFVGWYDAYVDEVLLVEAELIHPAYKYRGHPDLILVLRGDSSAAICDLKTPAAVSKSWRLQLGAYYELARANKIDVGRSFSLRLKSNGGFPLLDEYDPDPKTGLVEVECPEWLAQKKGFI